MDLFDKIMKEMENHRKNHVKCILPGRKLIVKQFYQLFLLEFEESKSSYQESPEDISISLLLDGFVITCDDGGNSLNILIALANCTQFDVVDGKIKIDLWFRLWEWAEKSLSDNHIQ